MSKPSEPVGAKTSPIDISSEPSGIVRANSKRSLRKKGSSSNLSAAGDSADPTPSSTSSGSRDSSDVRTGEATSSSKMPIVNVGSPNSISAAIQSGRRQKTSGKSKSGSPSEEEDPNNNGKHNDSPTIVVKPQGDPVGQFRPMPQYQAAIASDPNLTYIPTRVYLVSDTNYISYQSMALQTGPANALQPKPLEFYAFSVGKRWNLTTLLLIAGEKLKMTALSLYLKARLARVISINDLREDDELIVCSNAEGPFALLDRKEQAPPFLRLSPRQRLNSAPASDFSASSSSSTSSASLNLNLTGVSSPTKSESAPKPRPPPTTSGSNHSGSGSAVPESPSKTVIAPSPPKRDGDATRTNPSTSSASAATPPTPDSAPVGRKKSNKNVAVGSTSATATAGSPSSSSPNANNNKDDDASSNSSSNNASPAKVSRKVKGGTLPSSSSSSTSNAPTSSVKSAMSASTDSLDKVLLNTYAGSTSSTMTPSKKSSTKSRKASSRTASSGSKFDVFASLYDDASDLTLMGGGVASASAAVAAASSSASVGRSKSVVYSTPITSQLPFEGRRLVRRDSTSFLDTMRNAEIKSTALAAIKEHDRTLAVSEEHPIVLCHGDTGSERRNFSVEVLYVELKRSRSVPDVWMLGATRRKFPSLSAWGNLSSPLLWSPSLQLSSLDGSASTSATSTYRGDEEDEDPSLSEEDSSSLTSSTNDGASSTSSFGVGGDDKDLNPLTMTEEEVIKRMAHEEKQDVANLHVHENEIQAGTLRALIRRLFWEYQNDDFIHHFLLTYDLFINHLSLLKTLIMLFRVPIADTATAASPKAGGSFTPTMSTRRNLKIQGLGGGAGGGGGGASSSSSTGNIKRSVDPEFSSSSSTAAISPRGGYGSFQGTPRGESSSPTSNSILMANGGSGSGAIGGSRFGTGDLLSESEDKNDKHPHHGQGGGNGHGLGHGHHHNISPPIVVPDSIAAIASASGSSSTALLANASGLKTVIQHRIFTTIKTWIEWRYESLSLKSNRAFFVLFNEFCEFLSNSNVDKHKVYATALLQAVKAAKWNYVMMKRQVQLSKPPSSKANKMAAQAANAAAASSSSSSSGTPKMIDISPKDWARYFTLREQYWYGRVRLKEYRLANINSKDMAKSPHLCKLINHFNKLSFWAATAILRCEGFPDSTPRARAQVISHFLKIMDELRLLQNFSSMMAIYSALNLTPVSRLEKTWSHVPSEDKNLMKEVARLRDSNFKVYREKLEVAEPPLIPIQEVLMKDLTFIEENPTILDNGWINFSKIFMLGKAYKALKKSQTTPYEFKYPAGAYACHKLHGNMTLEAMYDFSKAVEPSATDLERIAKAESEKRDAEKREKKFKELVAKYSKKMPSKQDLNQLFAQDPTLDVLVTQPEAAAAFYVHLGQVCESSSLDYYRVWFNEWKPLVVSLAKQMGSSSSSSLSSASSSPPISAATEKLIEKMKDLGGRIYDTYLSATSDHAISLNTQGARQNVYRAVRVPNSSVNADLFDPINLEVKARLKPLLVDFKRSLESN